MNVSMMDPAKEKEATEQEKKEVEAKMALAWSKLTGDKEGVRDYDYAYELLKKCEGKHPEATALIGLCLEFGLGCEQDVKEAGNKYAKEKCEIGKLLLRNGRADMGTGMMKVKALEDSESRIAFAKLMTIAPWHSLDVTRVKFDDELTNSFLESLKSNTTLTDVNLTGIWSDRVQAEKIRDVLLSNTTLTKLNLSHNSIGHDGFETIIEALKVNTTLNALILQGVRHEAIDKDGTKIGEALRVNSTLTSLNLWNDNIGVEGAKAISYGLKTNVSLTELNLNSNNIGTQGTIELMDALKSNKTLACLCLGSNGIGVEGIEKVNECLAVNSTLATLNLANDITDEGATKICEFMRSNSTLTSLNLRWNLIKKEGMDMIAEAMKSNSTLTDLATGGNLVPYVPH